MKLVVGLGNPGAKYRGTRHNVGFDVADELGRRAGVSFETAPAEALVARVRRPDAEPVLLAKPLTFVNESGGAVADLARYYRIGPEDVLVVVDEVNLPLGRLRARARGSAGGHNGLKSVIEQLGTEEFARLRIGVGRGDPRRALSDHVLARFDEDERQEVNDAIARASDAAEAFVTRGIDAVMNTYNGDDRVPAE